jgi:hypothetical protein
MQDVATWTKEAVPGSYSISTHAIKIEWQKEFTADVVVGWRQTQGLLIPHCPTEEPSKWIETDPERHAELVRQRNKKFDEPIFSRQVRIMKYLNRRWKMQDPQERKPLSSFHITALALKILTAQAPHEVWTPQFCTQAAVLVQSPLEDPAGIGDDLVARDPDYASALLAEAGKKTAAALKASSDAEAERLLREVFGDPDELAAVLGEGPVSVSSSGALIGAATGKRVVKPVRSHGDGG